MRGSAPLPVGGNDFPRTPSISPPGSAVSADVTSAARSLRHSLEFPSAVGMKEMRGSAPLPAGGNDFPRTPRFRLSLFAASAEERSCFESSRRKIWRFSAGKTALQKFFLRPSAHFSPHFGTNSDAKNDNASFWLFGLSAKQFPKRRPSTAWLREPSWRSGEPAGPAPSCPAWPTWPSETAPDRRA